MTKRLVEYIWRQALSRTFVSVAAEVGVEDQTVKNVLEEYVRLVEENTKLPTPEYLGMDEVFVLKDYRTVLINLKEGTVFDLLKDRKVSTLEPYFKTLPDRDRIKVVCIDMRRESRPLIRRALPNAAIVVDKFHVLRLTTAVIEKVRKEIREQMPKKARLQLMHDRFLLYRHRENLTDDEGHVLDSWLNSYPLLDKVYELKEVFYRIWDAKTREEAERRYTEWKVSIPREMISLFRLVTRPVDSWHEEIFAYWDFPIPVTNAATEAFNSVIRVIVRQGRGYDFEVLRRKLIYDHLLRRRRPMPHKKKHLHLVLGDSRSK